MQIHRFHQLLLLMALVIVVPAIGQQEQNLDRNHNEQVTIIGSFDPTINQAFKINVKPAQKPLTFTAPEFAFQSLDSRVETDIAASQIKPLSIRADKRVKVYNNYLKAGFGSQLSPLLDFYHSSGKAGSYRFNAVVRSFSSFANIAGYSPSPYSNNKIAAGFEKYSKYHTLDLGLQYGLNTNRYYGFKPDDFPLVTIPDDEGLKQSFNLIRANIGFKSKYKNRNKLHHAVNLSGYYYFDRHRASETNASLDFDFHKGFDLTDVLDYQNLGLEGEATYFGNKDSVRSTTDVLITASPYFKAKYGILAFGVTLRFSYLNADESSFHFYPVIDLSVAAIPEALVLYAGLDGNIQKNSYLNLTTVNPYFTPYGIPDTNLRWQNNKIVAFGGLRGNIVKKLAYNLEVRWSKFEDMAFFVNSARYYGNFVGYGPANKFTILYDDGNRLTFKGELSYAVDSYLNVWFGGEYNSYSLDNLELAYHKPLSEINLGASYLFKRKLKVWTELFYYGKRYARTPTVFWTFSNQEVLGSFFDINLGADYAVSREFSVFLSVTNLLNNNYERFYSYPVQGVNVMAGVALKF
ncbi:MAG: hypothetical protein L3J66_02155 [Bacteroidales bacterium]|nr:hypothetical protein [Bacteroidales bacterium]